MWRIGFLSSRLHGHFRSSEVVGCDQRYSCKGGAGLTTPASGRSRRIRMPCHSIACNSSGCRGIADFPVACGPFLVTTTPQVIATCASCSNRALSRPSSSFDRCARGASSSSLDCNAQCRCNQYKPRCRWLSKLLKQGRTSSAASSVFQKPAANCAESSVAKTSLGGGDCLI